MNSDPYSLEWGKATADLFSDVKRQAIHVVNYDLASAANRRRSIRFLRGRLKWFLRHLPAGTVQRVLVDDRGQALDGDQRREVMAALQSLSVEISYASERPKHGV